MWRLLLATLGLLALVGRKLTARGKPDATDSPNAHGLAFDAVFFPSRDGVKLHGWWIPVEQAQGTIVQCHGRTGSMDADIGTAKALHEAGFNVLIFNFRAHGTSDGDAVTYGWFEAYDVLGAIDFLDRQYGVNRVGVLGFSMGAGAAIRAATLTNRIACVVVDGLVGRMETTLISWLQEKGIPEWLAGPFLKTALWLEGLRVGAPLWKIHPVEWVADLRNCPVLIIHGAEDRLVPMHEIETVMANAAVETHLWVVPTCDHREAYETYPDEYLLQVVKWFSEFL